MSAGDSTGASNRDIDEAEPVSEQSSDASPEQSMEEFIEMGDSNMVRLNKELVERGQSLADIVISKLRRGLSSTEEAALEIGEQVSSLFSIAQAVRESATRTFANVLGNRSETGTLDRPLSTEINAENSVVEMIHAQKEDIILFSGATRKFVHQQQEMSRCSSEAVFEVLDCVRKISKIVLSSEVLALNVQIESVRLGESGRAFTVLGEQMSDFSFQIHEANLAIQKSVNLLADLIKQSNEQSREMGNRVGEFSIVVESRIEGLESKTNDLTETLHETLRELTASNDRMMSHSRAALSALQYQDPHSQDLARMIYEIEKIRSLITCGDLDETQNACLDPRIGREARHDREAGLVEFF